MIWFATLINIMLISGDAGGALSNSNSTDYSDCPNDFSILEKALYDIKGNKANLTNIFYLPQKHPLEFVRVHYFFQNMTTGKDDKCNVEFLWVSEGFLLIQPPSVFRFSSLFFGNAVDKRESVRLTLPLECLPALGDNCSCHSSTRDNYMVLLTKQLKLYAKYSSPDRVVQNDVGMVKALCAYKLHMTYYDPDLKNITSNGYSVFMFFLFAFIIPFISIILMAAIARSWQKVIHVKITRASNNANVAALVITSFFVTLFITGLDLTSIIYAYKKKTEIDGALNHLEASRSIMYIKEHTVNFLITIILTIYDGIIFFTFSVFPLIYVCIIELKCGNCDNCFLKTSKCLCFPCFFLIFGTRNHNDSWKLHDHEFPQDPREEYIQLDSKKLANNRLMWLFMHTTAAPAFSLAGHLGFILISWIINPAQATAIFIQYIVILVFLYVLARQCYLTLEV